MCATYRGSCDVLGMDLIGAKGCRRGEGYDIDCGPYSLPGCSSFSWCMEEGGEQERGVVNGSACVGGLRATGNDLATGCTIGLKPTLAALRCSGTDSLECDRPVEEAGFDM